MRKNPFLLLSLGAFLATAPVTAQQKKPAAAPAATTAAGTRLIEKVTRKPGELVIPYEKYLLPNGLTLIVTEDHSDPLVHVDVTYHVGSAREQIGKSGFAHFFEHMMFEGSDHAPQGTFDKVIIGAGGTNNGSTNRDRTNYYETIPSNQLERALWLEADRMGFLLDAVTQKRFEVQRATVKNERGQNYDNRPYGLVSEYVAKTLYPYGHPYSWLTIGYLEDLDRSDVNDLKQFFLRWYGPNNATLTVGGDVKPAEVVAMAEKYFGSINRGPAVQNMKLPEPKLTQDRYVSYQDNVRFPLVQMVFPTVPQNHPDETALDALAEIIGGGKNSLLYKNLIKSQKAVTAVAYHPTAELGGEFTLAARAFPGKGLDSLEYQLRQTLTEFEKRGVKDEDLQRFKASREADLVSSLSSVSGKVSRLAANQTFTGNPNYLTVELQRLRALTKADVQRVYGQYVKGKKAVVLSVLPKAAPASPARPDNFTVSKEGYKAPADEYKGLTYVKAKDTFDRGKMPGAGANPVVKVPALWQQQFQNGLRVMGSRNTEVPTVNMLLTIRGGHRLEQANPGKAGLAALTATMLNEGSQKYTGEQLADALDRLGSSITVSPGTDNTTVSVQSLTKNLPATLALLEEVLLRPRFDAADFARVKKQALEAIANQSTQPTVIADKTYNALLYGSGDIMSVPVSGTTSTMQSITLDDVKQFYQQYYGPDLSHLVIVGDVEQKDVVSKLGFLQNWNRKGVTLPAGNPSQQPDKTRIYFVNKPDAAQSEIRIGYLALPYDATGEYYRAYLANYLLGGSFASRINHNLREEKGYTYGAYSGFRGTRYVGPFTAQAGVRADATTASLTEFGKEIKGFTTGINDDELQLLKTSVGQSDALKYETGQQKAAFLARLLEYDLTPDFVQQQNAILQNLKKEDVQATAQKYLPVDKMYIVVVGDRNKVFPDITTLGYEIVEMDAEGNRLTKAVPAASTVTAAPATSASDSKAVKKAKSKTKDEDGRKAKRKLKKDEDGTKVKEKAE
ncbi:M16 family metallopeptidase [Hymenobacter cellulosivorans]|uniref:Insulinase family protein n=1 Tax=Hymenobacter cellulosivorans TaxID=2932249 RepID=A0ABY4FCC2_9BACT|nr:pitrilysin family protein [Hymenobacter cellulosivorans]UOQ54133.1 insulinase family protein [Hymenobacter cellulosivorans]